VEEEKKQARVRGGVFGLKKFGSKAKADQKVGKTSVGGFEGPAIGPG